MENNQKRYSAKNKGRKPGKKQSSGHARKAKGEDAQLRNILGELTSAVKQFLEATIENQQRLTVAKEKQTEALTKISGALPQYVRGVAPGPKPPRRHKISEEKKKILDLVKRLRGEGMTYEEVAAYLEENKIPTLSGRGHWHTQTIHRLCYYY